MGEIIPLLEVWTVQDKPSKKKGRYGFEVRVLHTVSAHSLMYVSHNQREDWVGVVAIGFLPLLFLWSVVPFSTTFHLF